MSDVETSVQKTVLLSSFDFQVIIQLRHSLLQSQYHDT